MPLDQPPSALSDVIERLRAAALPANRKRDLQSAIRRVCHALRTVPQHLPAEPGALRERLASVDPLALGATPKTRANVLSNLAAALGAAAQDLDRAKAGHSRAWTALLGNEAKRLRYGLSRLATWCSAQGFTPTGVNESVFEEFEARVRARSVSTDIDRRLRSIRKAWNELAGRSGGDLQGVTITPRSRPCRIPWGDLPASFRADVEAHLDWAATKDPFAPNVRPRPLSKGSIHLRREIIHSAVHSLIASGWPLERLDSLAAIVTPEAFREILRTRYASHGGQPNPYDYGLAKALVAIAKEWVRPDLSTLNELRGLQKVLDAPKAGLTEKNKALLRHFDDPALLDRLLHVPDVLWNQATRRNDPARRLHDAQTALAILILLHAPLRIANLAALSFGKNLFLPPKVGETRIEFEPAVMKTREAFCLVLPSRVTKMLAKYQTIAETFWKGPERPLFVNEDGSAKKTATLARRIESTLKHELGISMTSHQFRHLAGKLILDANPGAYEILRQILGHKNLSTTISFYAPLDTARVSRIHADIIKDHQRSRSVPRRKKS